MAFIPRLFPRPAAPAAPADAYVLGMRLPAHLVESDTEHYALDERLRRAGWEPLVSGATYVLPVPPGALVGIATASSASSVADQVDDLLPAGTHYTVVELVHGSPVTVAGERTAPGGQWFESAGPRVIHEPDAALPWSR